MKVLVVIDTLSFGGAEKLLAVLAEARSEHLQMSVLTLPPPSDPRTESLPVLRGAGLEVSFAGITRLLQPSAVPRLVRAIRESDCDVVHAHLGYSSILAPLAARIAGRPSVSTLHHVPEELSRRDGIKEQLMVTVSGRLGILVFVSEASRDAFAARYRSRPSWRVVPNGIDLSRFSGNVEPAADLGVPPGSPTVSIVAALRAPKGHEIAIRAWPAVLEQVPDAHLLVAGDGNHRTHLEQLSKELGLEERVIFCGSRDDVPEVWRASTLAALPSYTEALPTALVEAAACGLASVATTAGGIPEVVRDGVTGTLVAPHDVGAFAAAVTDLLLDGDRRRRYGLAARHHVEQKFDREVWIERLLALYEEALAGGATPSAG